MLFAVAICALFVARAWRDLSTAGPWAYWKDLYFTPSLSASVVHSDTGGEQRPALAISGRIGAAAASWFRNQLDEAKLTAGDLVVFSSPGGNVDQAMLIGETIRARGLATAVGVFNAEGSLQPAYCASACVLAFAGGKVRIGVSGSRLGVHRFTTDASGRDAVADTQRLTGLILGYMTRMGVSSSVVEAMSATRDIRWLSSQEATEARLVTSPLDTH